MAIIDFLANNKKARNALFTLLMVLFLIWIVKRQVDKIKLANARKKAQRDINTSNLTKQDSFYRALALRLKTAFEGWVFVGWRDTERTEAIEALNLLNDDEFIQVYVYFGNHTLDGTFGVSKKETLRGWISSENMPFTWADDNALTRMDELGLV